MMEDKRISRTEKAYLALKNDIIMSKLPPDYCAFETDYAQMLGMSRTPVREALLKLEAEGLMEIRPRHGARVRGLNTQEIKKICQCLAMIESSAAEILAQDGIAVQPLQRLEELITLMDDALKNEGGYHAWVKADDEFHRTIIRAINNTIIDQLTIPLLERLQRVRMSAANLSDIPYASSDEHKLILIAIVNHEPNSAKRFVNHYYTRGADC